MNMDDILNFLADNYKWFMIAAGVLLIALIGLLTKNKKKGETNENDNVMATQDNTQLANQTLPETGNIENSNVNIAPSVAPEPTLTFDTPANPEVSVAATIPESNPVTEIPAVSPESMNDTIQIGEPISIDTPIVEESNVITEPVSESLTMEQAVNEAILPEVQPAFETTPTTEVNPVQINAEPVETPVYTAPVETAPAYTAPVETQAYTAPVETAPAYTAPVETSVYTAPVETAPAYTAPVETPVYTAPVEASPAYTAPVETPVYTAPVEATPTENTVVNIENNTF